MRIKKRFVSYALIFLLIIIIAFLLLNRKPSYPNISTEKPVEGNASAKILIEEFSDLQCPACARAQEVVKQILDEHGDRIKLEFHHYPLTTLHPNAFRAAMAAECANDQGKFWEYVKLAYKNQQRLDNKGLKELARILELDTDLFSACLDSEAKKAVVLRDMELGNSKGIRGTPTFFINNKKLTSWQYEEFKKTVEAELKK